MVCHFPPPSFPLFLLPPPSLLPLIPIWEVYDGFSSILILPFIFSVPSLLHSCLPSSLSPLFPAFLLLFFPPFPFPLFSLDQPGIPASSSYCYFTPNIPRSEERRVGK